MDNEDYFSYGTTILDAEVIPVMGHTFRYDSRGPSSDFKIANNTCPLKAIIKLRVVGEEVGVMSISPIVADISEGIDIAKPLLDKARLIDSADSSRFERIMSIAEGERECLDRLTAWCTAKGFPHGATVSCVFIVDLVALMCDYLDKVEVKCSSCDTYKECRVKDYKEVII